MESKYYFVQLINVFIDLLYIYNFITIPINKILHKYYVLRLKFDFRLKPFSNGASFERGLLMFYAYLFKFLVNL